MGAAELVDLMMNFVIYPCLIIVHAIVQKSVVYIFLIQPVDYLNKIFILNHIQQYNSIRKGKNQYQQLRKNCATYAKHLSKHTSILVKLIITPPFVPHGISLTYIVKVKSNDILTNRLDYTLKQRKLYHASQST